MIRIAVLGASGRTGRLVLAAVLQDPAAKLVAALTRASSSHCGTDAGSLVGQEPAGVVLIDAEAFDPSTCDVVIDFSTPDALAGMLPRLAHTPLVTGTTGLDPAQVALLAEHAATAPVLAAANFSTGVTVLLDLVARASAALPALDIEIIETHHRHKRDAPSGTALALGRAAAEARGWSLDDVAVHGRHGDTGARRREAIGFHAVRGGGVVGDHDVALLGDGESIRIQHRAASRSTFATGALTAARWLVGKPPGHWSLADALGLTRP